MGQVGTSLPEKFECLIARQSVNALSGDLSETHMDSHMWGRPLVVTVVGASVHQFCADCDPSSPSSGRQSINALSGGPSETYMDSHMWEVL